MISTDQFVAIMGAITALIIAVTTLYVQMKSTHKLVNSRMTELLELTRTSAIARGKLEATSPGAQEPPT